MCVNGVLVWTSVTDYSVSLCECVLCAVVCSFCPLYTSEEKGKKTAGFCQKELASGCRFKCKSFSKKWMEESTKSIDNDWKYSEVDHANGQLVHQMMCGQYNTLVFFLYTRKTEFHKSRLRKGVFLSGFTQNRLRIARFNEFCKYCALLFTSESYLLHATAFGGLPILNFVHSLYNDDTLFRILPGCCCCWRCWCCCCCFCYHG